MAKKLSLFVLLAGWVVLFTACNRTYDPVPEHVDRIFPLEQGKNRIYHVIDTVFLTSTTNVQAESFYKKETNDGTEEDLLGREVTVVRLDKSSDTLGFGNYTWEYDDLWTMYLDDDYAERIEGNTRYLVLRRPPLNGVTWDGNLFNGQDTRQYEYANVDTTVEVNGTIYEQSVVVIQVPYRKLGGPTSFVEIEEYAYEVYVPDVGMVYKYSKYLEIQRDNPGDPGRIVDGSHVRIETLVDHNHF